MKVVALWLLRGYKRWVSPAFPPSCRYVPTCSEYAMEAVELYGALRGGAMAAWRVLRCHPFVRGGYDPVVKGPTHRIVRDEWGTQCCSTRVDKTAELRSAGQPRAVVPTLKITSY